MSRQLDQKRELRETTRRDALIRALEFGLVGALASFGIEMLGFSIKYESFDCLLTLKAEIKGVRSVAFVSSDTIMNVLLKTDSMAANHSLRWRPDRYHSSGD